MHKTQTSVLLVAMPFAGLVIPSIQLPVLEAYGKHHGITIHTRHLYLKAAELYGLQHYNALIYPPNDSYTAQLSFSKHVFPDHWKKNEENIKEYYTTHLTQTNETSLFSFEDYVRRTDQFLSWALDHVDWRSADLIGFTLNYGQLLPSLALAQKIKALAPDKQIILGGSRTMGDLGRHILQSFEYVDYVVSGDGEDALFRLASGENLEAIPGLLYRDHGEVHGTTTNPGVDLSTAPLPSYDQFYQELATCSPEIQQFFSYYGRLPVEISRGCWWNRCSFCNLNVQHVCYREKPVENIIKEITWLAERYQMTEFQLIGNTLPQTEYRTLFERLRDLGRGYSLFVEARAGQLKSDDYRLMRDAGFTAIQTGIESFSRHYLRTMNKGVRVIDNIAALKFCKEQMIQNSYNLIVRYPNEEPVDFEETKQVVSLVKGYLDPPQVCELRVMYGSQIQRDPARFNINQLTNAPVDELMFPDEVLQNGVAFVYGFTQRTPVQENDWESLVEDWKAAAEHRACEAVKSRTMIDSLLFYFVDGGSFLKIFDKRDAQNIRIFVLNAVERAVLLACVDVVSLDQLQQRLPQVPEFKLVAILQSFEKNGLVFVEDDWYVCLPLRYSVRVAAEQQVDCQTPAVA
ncbi:MAG: RiPP maturation radical SAM C-methyltransferase [Candidatus Thermoplasmatota archaeon]|nr:RiPP maturation radical SAM C-methyltransferase [Candidatus Thermoplasmatota archaeon]